jgi:hypothetical protein
MKKYLVGLFALTLITGCGTKTIVVEKPANTTKTPVVTSPPYVSDDQNFIEGLVADFPREVAFLGKTKIVEMGHLACQAIDEGATISDFVALATNNNVDAGFIGALIRESVHNFCPENQWFIDSVLNA